MIGAALAAVVAGFVRSAPHAVVVCAMLSATFGVLSAGSLSLAKRLGLGDEDFQDTARALGSVGMLSLSFLLALFCAAAAASGILAFIPR